MTNKPFALTDVEIKEIASVKEIQELWAAENAADMKLTLSELYTAKFEFMNDSPGYVGDLFVIQPGYLSSELPVIRLVRDRERKLKIIN
jgi:hypothetical protein